MDTLSISMQGNPHHDEMSLLLRIAFDRAMRLESEISEDCLRLNGMSGRRYRMFINNLVRVFSRPRYLEVGSWAGSTACAAMDRNILKMLCIDNWSQFGGPKEQFFEAVNKFRTSNVEFDFVERDFREVDIETRGKFNIYLFDGPHEEKDQYDGLHMYDCALSNDFVFIVDDWNHPPVPRGTFGAIRDAGFRIDFAIEIRTTLDGSHSMARYQDSDWHNGYLFAKLSRIRPHV